MSALINFIDLYSLPLLPVYTYGTSIDRISWIEMKRCPDSDTTQNGNMLPFIA